MGGFGGGGWGSGGGTGVITGVGGRWNSVNVSGFYLCLMIDLLPTTEGRSSYVGRPLKFPFAGKNKLLLPKRTGFGRMFVKSSLFLKIKMPK